MWERARSKDNNEPFELRRKLPAEEAKPFTARLFSSEFNPCAYRCPSVFRSVQPTFTDGTRPFSNPGWKGVNAHAPRKCTNVSYPYYCHAHAPTPLLLHDDRWASPIRDVPPGNRCLSPLYSCALEDHRFLPCSLTNFSVASHKRMTPTWRKLKENWYHLVFYEEFIDSRFIIWQRPTSESIRRDFSMVLMETSSPFVPNILLWLRLLETTCTWYWVKETWYPTSFRITNRYQR